MSGRESRGSVEIQILGLRPEELNLLGRALLDSSPEGILVADAQGTIIYANAAYTRALPPLRERREDIPLLVAHLLNRLSRKAGKRVSGNSPEAMDLLRGYCWPGNVRELENVLERALVLVEEGKPIRPEHVLLPRIRSVATEAIFPLRELEADMIRRALDRFGTSVEGKRRAARALGISLSTLYDKLKRMGGAVSDSRKFDSQKKKTVPS